MTTNSTSPPADRRRRPKHAARRTRLGLGIGAAVTTLGLTGAYWVGDLGPVTTAASAPTSQSSDSSVSSETVTDSTETYEPSQLEDEDDYDEDDTSSTVDVTPSFGPPDTSSRAS